MTITIDLLKAQFEREKRMLEDKIREVTAATARELDLKKELEDLQKKLSSYEDERGQLVGTLRGLREKVGGIEKQFGNEIVVRLHGLRQEVFNKVDGKTN
jgi:predicted  nucleic acid-binding Zn-ribbon protein